MCGTRTCTRARLLVRALTFMEVGMVNESAYLLTMAKNEISEYLLQFKMSQLSVDSLNANISMDVVFPVNFHYS